MLQGVSFDIKAYTFCLSCMWLDMILCNNIPSSHTWQMAIAFTDMSNLMQQRKEQTDEGCLTDNTEIQQVVSQHGFVIHLVPILEGALRVLTAYCTKHGLVQCGEARKEGWQRGSFSMSRMRFNVMAQYVRRCCHGVSLQECIVQNVAPSPPETPRTI